MGKTCERTCNIHHYHIIIIELLLSSMHFASILCVCVFAMRKISCLILAGNSYICLGIVCVCNARYAHVRCDLQIVHTNMRQNRHVPLFDLFAKLCSCERLTLVVSTVTHCHLYSLTFADNMKCIKLFDTRTNSCVDLTAVQYQFDTFVCISSAFGSCVRTF